MPTPGLISKENLKQILVFVPAVVYNIFVVLFSYQVNYITQKRICPACGLQILLCRVGPFFTPPFFEGLPEELFESARLDGCTEFGVLWRIVLPMSLPIMMTIGMYYAVAHWNAYMVAVLYITDQDLRPLQVILRRMLKAANMDMSADEVVPAETLKMAAVCFATAPIVVIYPFIQKYFVKGTLAGAVKG